MILDQFEGYMTHAPACSVHVGQSHSTYLQDLMWFYLHDDLKNTKLLIDKW